MYNGEYSITFFLEDSEIGRNTWTDWYLIPTSRPVMSIPNPQTKFVEIPGMSGSYDLSDYLTTEMTYADQSGSFEFIVDNDHADWIAIYTSVVEWIHGQRLRMRLSDDPGWYYEGRFSVDEFRSEKDNSRIVISYRVSPHRDP